MSAATRHVKVTVTGEASVMLDSHGNPTKAMRVRYAGAEREASVLVLTDSPGVTVEDVEPPRVWTDGDVIAGRVRALFRSGGEWHGAYGAPRSDRVANSLVDSRAWSILRYQAGDL